MDARFGRTTSRTMRPVRVRAHRRHNPGGTPASAYTQPRLHSNRAAGPEIPSFRVQTPQDSCFDRLRDAGTFHGLELTALDKEIKEPVMGFEPAMSYFPDQSFKLLPFRHRKQGNAGAFD